MLQVEPLTFFGINMAQYKTQISKVAAFMHWQYTHNTRMRGPQLTQLRPKMIAKLNWLDWRDVTASVDFTVAFFPYNGL